MTASALLFPSVAKLALLQPAAQIRFGLNPEQLVFGRRHEAAVSQ